MTERSPKDQVEWAMFVAQRWRKGRELTADADEVRDTLLGELERAREALQKIVGGRDSLTQSNIAYEALNPSTPLPLPRSRGTEALIAAQLALDAERFRWCVDNAAWLRHEHTAYVAIPVALESDLSCLVMRVHAIDVARAASPKRSTPYPHVDDIVNRRRAED